MASTVNLTTKWTRIDTKVTVNSGFLVTGGTSIELSTTLNPPLGTDKGIIINRNQFFNLYPSIVTYARATTGTAKILVDTTFLNFKSREFIIYTNDGLKYTINLDTKKLIVTLDTGSITPTLTISQIMSLLPTILSPFGVEVFHHGIRSNIFLVQAVSSGQWYPCFIAIDNATPEFRLIDWTTKAVLGAYDCKLLTGNLVLELLYI